MSENQTNSHEEIDGEVEKEALNSIGKNKSTDDKEPASNDKCDVQEDTNNEADKEGNNGQELKNDVDVSELEDKIISQIEYYFGDFNLKKDKFLCDQIALENGWVPLDVMLKFNRLASITKDKELIVSSLKKSKNDIVHVNEDNTKIRRNPDLPLIKEESDEQRLARQEKTVYVKGFPVTSSLGDILNFLTPYGKVDHVKMRKYEDKASKTWMFKGSVFVTFPTKEDAEAFLKLEDLKYEDKELLKLSFIVHKEMKKKERHEQKFEKKLQKFGDISRLPKGTLLQLTGIPTNSIVKDIRKQLEDSSWPVEFVEYEPGNTDARVRLKTEGSASQVLESLGDEKVVQISDVSVSVNLISGDEELQLLRKMEMEKSDRLKSKGNRGRKRPFEGDKNGGGGRRFKRR